MPIRQSEKGRYPKDWPAISAKIRQRAGNKCEDCSLPNYVLGGRTKDGKWHDAHPTGDNGLRLTWPRTGDYSECAGGHQLKIVRIVLTVGHLNHTPEDCRPKNLRCWCQQCHLRYDAKEKARGIKERRRSARAKGDLFESAA